MGFQRAANSSKAASTNPAGRCGHGYMYGQASAPENVAWARNPKFADAFAGELQLLHSPGLPGARISLRRLRCEPVEHNVIRGVHRHELPLEVSRKLRECQSVARQYPAHFVAISFALGGAL